MVKKLRKKFVVTAMSSLLVILIIMIGVINIANLRTMINDADNLLAILVDNNGSFPGMPPFNMPFKEGQFNPVNPFALDMLNNTRSAEMPYQSRYFMVIMDAEGVVVLKDLLHIAAISEEDAEQIAAQAFQSPKEKGIYQSYRYRKKTLENNNSIIVFLDISSSIINAYSLLFQSLLIGAFTLIAMFILVFLFSGKAVAPVVESLEKQKRFITDAGHELKTPLAVISANVDVLELESGKSEWTGSIRNQIKRMNSLIKDMLTLSRMDEERMQVVFSDFDLSAAVKETANSFQPLAESKNKNYQINITDGIHLTGDRNAITQLTSLLLDNAMKYSSENGNVNVNLTSAKNITLEVTNTCDSIPEGNLDRLFDRFYRADSSRSRETGGFGIGLSVAKSIALSHGGDIAAVKAGDNLIKFVVTLPKVLQKNKRKMMTDSSNNR